MSEDRLTVLTILARSEQYFRKAGLDSPRLDAEVLLAFALGISRIELYTGYDRPLTYEETATCRELVRRRADRVPVAYITGMKEFHSLEFTVDERVLIPRPETEHLVDAAVELAEALDEPRLLDIGTGSGAIAVAFAVVCSEARFVATDLSADALTVAHINAERHGVADRGEFLEGDFYAPLKDQAPFDLIVSNPPYVAPDEEVDPECLKEPRLALFTDDPVAVYRRLLEGAPDHLKPGGHVLLEIPENREEEITAAAPPELTVERVIRDFPGHPRVLVAKKGSDPFFAAPSA
jgi:release factor glutamine methyltransferase